MKKGYNLPQYGTGEVLSKNAGTIGSVLGGVVGSIVPGIGTAIGASVGGGLGSLVGAATTKDQITTPDYLPQPSPVGYPTNGVGYKGLYKMGGKLRKGPIRKPSVVNNEDSLQPLSKSAYLVKGEKHSGKDGGVPFDAQSDGMIDGLVEGGEVVKDFPDHLMIYSDKLSPSDFVTDYLKSNRLGSLKGTYAKAAKSLERKASKYEEKMESGNEASYNTGKLMLARVNDGMEALTKDQQMKNKGNGNTYKYGGKLKKYGPGGEIYSPYPILPFERPNPYDNYETPNFPMPNQPPQEYPNYVMSPNYVPSTVPATRPQQSTASGQQSVPAVTRREVPNATLAANTPTLQGVQAPNLSNSLASVEVGEAPPTRTRGIEGGVEGGKGLGQYGDYINLGMQAITNAVIQSKQKTSVPRTQIQQQPYVETTPNVEALNRNERLARQMIREGRYSGVGNKGAFAAQVIANSQDRTNQITQQDQIREDQNRIAYNRSQQFVNSQQAQLDNQNNILNNQLYNQSLANYASLASGTAKGIADIRTKEQLSERDRYLAELRKVIFKDLYSVKDIPDYIQ